MKVYCLSGFPFDYCSEGQLYVGTKAEAFSLARDNSKSDKDSEDGYDCTVVETVLASPITREVILNMLNHQGFVQHHGTEWRFNKGRLVQTRQREEIKA